MGCGVAAGAWAKTGPAITHPNNHADQSFLVINPLAAIVLEMEKECNPSTEQYSPAFIGVVSRSGLDLAG